MRLQHVAELLNKLLFLHILNKGILQMIGVDLGRGLDLPL
jgi:hypothetical protein